MSNPPYKPGDRIYDLTGNPLYGTASSFEIVACLPIAPALAKAARARWHLIVLLANGHYHNLWVDDNGLTGGKGFGPEPPEVDVDALLAAHPEVDL